MTRLLRMILLFCLVYGIALPFDPSMAASREWMRRVDTWVLETAATGETEFIVYLKEQADLRTAASLPDKLSKTAFVVQTLQATADRSQKPIRQILEAMGVEYRSYWVANILWVRGGMQIVQVLANRPEVAHLYANPTVKLDEPKNQVIPAQAMPSPGIEWNLKQVNADKVWAAGYTGQGVVIGGADTGYQWNHPALKQQYRGWNGQTADHNYNWHDAIHGDNPHTSPGNPCGFDSQQPCDDYGHGTHTMGIMVGDDSAGNQIGMAPGARWIGCRNMEQGWGSPATYIECYQWFMAPTDLKGMNPDPTQAPHVINNSWSCPPEEGCEDPNVLLQVVENVRAAGILTVHSAGNQGPACETIRDPAAIYEASLTVGNTTALDGLNTSSSRGPVISDGSGRLKPDVVAPGSVIRSSYPTNTYAYLSGTSMAAPHVAGMAALLISANPALAGKIDMLEQWITQTANPISIPLETCGGISSTTIPNNSFGWGRINAWGPFNRRLHLNLTAVPSAVRPSGIITYTLTVSNFHLTETAYNLILTNTLPAKTVLLSATLPYQFINDTLRWEREELMPGTNWAVQLVVLNTGLSGAQIVNNRYDISSQGDWFYTFGEAVRTPILFDFFFPVLIKSTAP